MIIFIGCAIIMMSMLGCAKTERAVKGTGRVVIGTRQFIEERVHISDQERWNRDDPLYWQMWQDSQGGG